jgi:hypothetical protein
MHAAEHGERRRAILRGDLASWRDVALTQIEESGQQQMLNCFCLMGAMHELDRRVAWSDFVETHIFNSDKVTAIFEPWLVETASSASST